MVHGYDAPTVYHWHYSLIVLTWQRRIVMNAARPPWIKQQDENGLFPRRNGKGRSRCITPVFAMDAFLLIAQMSQKTGFDLWNYTSPTGKSLKKSFVAIKPYLVK